MSTLVLDSVPIWLQNYLIPGRFDNAKDKSFKLFQMGITNGQVDTESVP